MKHLKFLAFGLLISSMLFIAGWSLRPPPVEPTVDHSPILMLHGLFGSPRNWNGLKSYLVDQGYDGAKIYTPKMVDNYSMCSTGHSIQIEAEIAAIMSETGAINVTVIGHSRGGTAIMNYMWYIDGEDVSKVITLAGTNLVPCSGQLPIDVTPGETPYTSIYSKDDGLVPVGMSHLEGAENIEVDGISHIGFIYSNKIFKIVQQQLEK